MIDETLDRLSRDDDGVESIVLAGIDGVVVAMSGTGGRVAPDDMAAAFSDLFRKVRAAHRDAGLPAPRELMSASLRGRVLVREVTEDYLLLALIGDRAIAGRTRFAMERAAASLAPELV